MTTFVTGAEGMLGQELVRTLVADGHRVAALTPSAHVAERVRQSGATPVAGDLRTPGRWQDEAAADWVFHVPPQLVDRGRVSRTRPAAEGRHRAVLDANLLDAVTAGPTRRIVYVADSTCFAKGGSRPMTEDEQAQPSPSGRGLAPAFERLDGYVLAGLPIVTAVPGCVYGDGSWFRELVIEPILAGRRVWGFGTPGALVSPVHVHDCSRALVHLAARGGRGGCYFIANSEPVRTCAFSSTFARLANRPRRVWHLPPLAAPFVLGRARAELLLNDAVLSNIRLRGLGFRFEFPTLEDGVRQILHAIHG